MRKTVTLASSVALIAVFSAALSQPAKAFDFASILQSLSTGISGWTELDTREAEMNNQINVAANSGQLTASEANAFRIEMSHIAQIEAQIKASGRRLGTTDSISFTNSLNTLATRIQTAIDSKTNVNTASLSDVDALRAQLNRQVTDASSAGNLTQTDAMNLKRELDHNTDIEDAFKSSGDGTLTPRQVQVISDDLKKIRVHINEQVKVAQSAIPQLNYQRTTVEQQIASAQNAGTLSTSQAADFRRELARIAAMQQSFLASDGGLSSSEVLSLAGELDRLADRIDSQIRLSPGQPVPIAGQSTASIDARQVQLTTRIDESLSSGRISSQMAADLKHELQHIGMIEAAYQSNPSGLTLEQIQKISAELDEMNARVDQQTATHTPAPGLPTTGVDLDTRLEQLRRRISDAIPQGKITQQEANQLYSDLDQITNNIQSVKDDIGNISDEDQLALQGDLDRVGYRVDQLLRMRRMGLAQIDASRARLLKRINDGQNAGNLSRLEAALLKREYNRISRTEAQFKVSTGGTLSYNQSARLSSDLTQLDQLLTSEITARAHGGASYR